ncbi:MFS transporter [Georgenia yuyongxinii]|uniref:MFS transporter n=1 Tax=Georgenia yuyongxinii TaxID=2589797 RepID=A0A552WR42_9MICO|nr:MFS transporter [Georgenia yuyongxinii]TRW45271.1 MFS transporter [Georgenia yuyongxinii]
MSNVHAGQAVRPDHTRETLILRKAFTRLIPFVIVMIFLSYVDRANLAILAGPIDASLGMSATAFGFATGLFFWGYVVFEIPSNIALMKFGSRTWLARIMVTWGLITGLMFFAQNEVHFGILRFLLGVAEAGLSPGLLLFITMWFPRSRQARPLSFFQISIPFAMIFGSLLTASLLRVFEGVAGSEGWRWVFLAEGALTVVIGVVVFLTLPSKPSDAKWLTDDDAAYITARIASEETTVTDSAEKLTEWQRIVRTMRSGKAWYLSLTYLAMLTGFWAITFFLPQIIAEGFGTSAVNSGFLSAIPWVFALVSILIVSRIAKGTTRPHLYLFTLLAMGAAGLVLTAVTDNPFAGLVGLTAALCGVQASLPLFYRLQTSLFTGVMTAVLLALVNSVGNFGGFIGPSIFGYSKDNLGGDGPALFIMASFLVLAALATLFSRQVLGTAGRVEAAPPASREDELTASATR